MAPNSIQSLDRQERLTDVLKKDEAQWKDDCLPCRLTGSAAFIGLGIYSYFSGQSQLKAQESKILKSKSVFGMRSRQTSITGIALTLVGMGLWRLKN
ncbi:7a8e6771-32d2-42ae-857f-f58c0a9787d7 [Sclerotinia trifoliorum]|uniref:7a8e6771-32d2-42ae-857f-f58c0a9787d7 n=1 Tax=Sclerotinia trifoliorum TaxID=28548 RepID=A0A8H2VW56_9HELO|nr:7a8e6771-32d2-42ae-857f-f58c0a9787d7 [Sclerotinia trifoliorum]